MRRFRIAEGGRACSASVKQLARLATFPLSGSSQLVMRKRSVWVASAYALVSLLGLGVAWGHASLRERPVRATGAVETRPVADGDWLAWGQAPMSRPIHFHVRARKGQGRPFRVSPRGTEALPGGIWRRFLVYEERRRGDWNIVLYDLARRKRLRAPRGVNTSADEVRPSLSGDWLLFTRFNRRTGREGGVVRVLLLNRRTREEIELARVNLPPSQRPAFDATQRPASWRVNGRYALANPCVGCGTRLYDIAQRTAVESPTGFIPHSIDFPVSVSASGPLHVARQVAINSWHADLLLLSRALGAEHAVLLARIPRGIGVGSMYVVSRPGGRTTVYYTRGFLCRIDSDVYALDVQEPSPGDGVG